MPGSDTPSNAEVGLISLGRQKFNAGIARTLPQWRAGLRGAAPGVDRMLFVMTTSARFPFHLAGLEGPILLAFFNSHGRLVELTHLSTEQTWYQPANPYKYALEIVMRELDVELIRDLTHGLDTATLP